jgi:hypothetical protein
MQLFIVVPSGINLKENDLDLSTAISSDVFVFLWITLTVLHVVGRMRLMHPYDYFSQIMQDEVGGTCRRDKKCVQNFSRENLKETIWETKV